MTEKNECKLTREELHNLRLEKHLCLVCGKPLPKEVEYVCSECFDKQMKEDMEYMKKNQEELTESEEWSIDWRFRDSRNRSVFKRE